MNLIIFRKKRFNSAQQNQPGRDLWGALSVLSPTENFGSLSAQSQLVVPLKETFNMNI